MSTNKLTYDGDIYLWNGSLTDLKCCRTHFKGAREWCSPGEDVKLFCDDESKFSIK
ncbi:Hypothetical predicted protein, partial [Paramuricea clavata]